MVVVVLGALAVGFAYARSANNAEKGGKHADFNWCNLKSNREYY